MLERQREDIAKAKAEGNTGDAHRRHEQRPQRFDACMANGIGPTEIAKRLGISERLSGSESVSVMGPHLTTPGVAKIKVGLIVARPI
jgi:hypothetical protein